jgi:hypothetical protein
VSVGKYEVHVEHSSPQGCHVDDGNPRVKQSAMHHALPRGGPRLSRCTSEELDPPTFPYFGQWALRGLALLVRWPSRLVSVLLLTRQLEGLCPPCPNSAAITRGW